MRRRAFHKTLAEGTRVGEVGREVRVAVRALLLLVEERDVVARVVRELVGVAGVERLGRAEDGCERVGVRQEERSRTWREILSEVLQLPQISISPLDTSEKPRQERR